MKTKLLLLATILITGIFFNSCTKMGQCSHPPAVSPSEYHLSSGQDSAELNIDSDTWWINSISINGDLIPDSVLTYSKDRDSIAGPGIAIKKVNNSLIKVNCAANHTGKTRTYKVSVQAGDCFGGFTVVQAGN